MILHTPVMLDEVCEYLPQNPQRIVDCTLGHGWHTMALLSLAKQATVVAFDVDQLMMDKARLQLTTKMDKNGQKLLDIDKRVEFVHGNYADIVAVLAWRKADYILNDLGVNLEHFKAVERGFSIRGEAPLDMRFDTSQAKTAATVVGTYSIAQLTTLFEQYADFSPSKALELAQHIVTKRKEHPIMTTQDLKLILNACGLGDKACTVIFQSIRIEVNNELDNLQKFLLAFPETLNLSWRCCMITYHSIEDRFVKQAFAALAATGKYRLVTKKAIKPNYKEVARNRAARSAKIRVLEKIN